MRQGHHKVSRRELLPTEYFLLGNPFDSSCLVAQFVDCRLNGLIKHITRLTRAGSATKRFTEDRLTGTTRFLQALFQVTQELHCVSRVVRYLKSLEPIELAALHSDEFARPERFVTVQNCTIFRNHRRGVDQVLVIDTLIQSGLVLVVSRGQQIHDTDMVRALIIPECVPEVVRNFIVRVRIANQTYTDRLAEWKTANERGPIKFGRVLLRIPLAGLLIDRRPDPDVPLIELSGLFRCILAFTSILLPVAKFLGRVFALIPFGVRKFLHVLESAIGLTGKKIGVQSLSASQDTLLPLHPIDSRIQPNILHVENAERRMLPRLLYLFPLEATRVTLLVPATLDLAFRHFLGFVQPLHADKQIAVLVQEENSVP